MQKTDYRLAQLNSAHYSWSLEQQRKKHFDYLQQTAALEASTDPQVCKFFACGKPLTLQERLCGDKCTTHSTEQPKVDVALYVSY